MIKITQIASIVWFAFQRIILPVLLPVLRYVIKDVIDELQEEIKREVAEKGPDIIDKVFDKHQKIALDKLKKLTHKPKISS